jgi:hypothetical protein
VIGLVLAGLALLLAIGCVAPSGGAEAMQMSADIYPPAASGKTAEAVTMPEWVRLYGRSSTGASVMVLQGGIRSVRVRRSTILIHEELGGAKSTWRIVVYDAPTGSLLVSDPETGSPVVVSKKVSTNADGSADVHFGLTPPRGREGNWIRTSAEIPW